jgi:hypothetical protein
MAMDVGAALLARKFPIRVEYGPEQTTRVAPQSVIVIDRDRNGSEAIGAAHGTGRNPKKVLARYLPCRALVYACSTEAGARVNEHEHECDRFVDALLSELETWTEANRAEVKYAGARFAAASDGVDDLETWPGVVYLVTFAIGRGVYAWDYTGAGQPEATLAGAGARGTIQVRRQGSAEPPEIVPIG